MHSEQIDWSGQSCDDRAEEPVAGAQVLFDHGKEEDLDLASCKVDWVQPEALAIAAAARKRLLEQTEQKREALMAQGTLRTFCISKTVVLKVYA